jgi:hypothetical protein
MGRKPNEKAREAEARGPGFKKIQAMRISYDPSFPLSHEAARLSVIRQDNNNRGMECHNALSNDSFVRPFSLGSARQHNSKN